VELLRQPGQNWKAGTGYVAGDRILSRAVKTDHFASRDIRASRNLVDVEREFRIIADGNFNGSRRRSHLAARVSDPGYSSANARRQPTKHVVRCFNRLGHRNRVKEN